MSWSTLSGDVWKHILLHVPLAHRLESCSRANTALYRAAAAATQQIDLCLEMAGVQRLLGLCQWMQQHGLHLTSLRASLHMGVPHETLNQLPCPNLRELDLTNIKVQLSASSTKPGVLHSCTRLTKLFLIHCPIADGYSSLVALSPMVGLQRLTIMGVVSGSTDDSIMPSTVLQHLTQLTHLSLIPASRLLSMESLQHTSCLVNLQELNLWYRTRASSTVPLSSSTTPSLSGLTTLRKVGLHHANLDPSILQDCTQLQDLDLHGVAIISAGGAAALHSLLGRLQQLQSLQLIELEYDWPVAAAAYTSLTASSHLHRLELDIDNLPPGIWQYVFLSNRQLPALRELAMGCLDEPGPPPPAAAAAAAAGTDDISRLASCCPGLHRINIEVQPGAQLSALAKVSDLASLSVSGLQREGFASLRALSGLVSLQDLYVCLGGPIAPQDLLCLTALTGLTRLLVDPSHLPEFEDVVNVNINLSQDEYVWHDTPVWLRLLEHCGRLSNCQPVIFNSMGRQLLEQQQQIAILQQQQQQLAYHCVMQQQQTLGLQAQLERMQAVDGQVLQLLQALGQPEG